MLIRGRAPSSSKPSTRIWTRFRGQGRRRRVTQTRHGAFWRGNKDGVRTSDIFSTRRALSPSSGRPRCRLGRHCSCAHMRARRCSSLVPVPVLRARPQAPPSGRPAGKRGDTGIRNRRRRTCQWPRSQSATTPPASRALPLETRGEGHRGDTTGGIPRSQNSCAAPRPPRRP